MVGLNKTGQMLLQEEYGNDTKNQLEPTVGLHPPFCMAEKIKSMREWYPSPRAIHRSTRTLLLQSKYHIKYLRGPVLSRLDVLAEVLVCPAGVSQVDN